MKERQSFSEFINRHGVNTFDIYNLNTKIEFLSDKYNYSSDDAKRNVINLFNQFGRVENKKNKDLYTFTENDFKDLFQTTILSYSTFNAIKSIVKSYLKWCVYKNLCEDEQMRMLEQIQSDHLSKKDQIRRYYFKDFYDLNNVINYKAGLLKENLELNLETAKIALYLAWMGVTIHDAVKIRRMDIDSNNKRIYIQSSNKHVKFDINTGGIFLEILSYSQIEWNGEKLGEDDYILRTVESSGDIVSAIRNLISFYFGANKRNGIDDNDRVINYQRVYFSGLFYRATAHYDKISMKNIELMSEIFDADASTASGYNLIYRRYRDFLSYCEYFYPEIYKSVKGYAK